MHESNVWLDTPGMLDRLKQLHAWGCTLSQIALALNAEYGMSFSRSAISGKIHRLGVRNQEEKRIEEQAEPVKQRRKVMERDQAKEQPKKPVKPPAPPPVVEAEPEFEPIVEAKPIVRIPMPPLQGGLSLDLLELNSATCKWPFGRMPPFTFCGHPVESEKVYCADHCEVAYNAARSRR
jgi:GcrA cell cycle regulator